ncbi:MAG: hypothetical protein M0Q23_06975 [Syntrophales bacterium]|nr:hypothetical protein [Syntrophales bacterium]MCK9528366.1 hypothetical protein [Syntrophales bacterium]MDX9922709.1 hypothetical protein [Syntrophales bacterium]
MKAWHAAVTVMAVIIMATGTGRADTPPRLTTTSEDRTSLELTVYSNDRGFIRDSRRVALPAGRCSLRFTDVADRIMPVTLHLSSPVDGPSPHILEQVYSYDLMSEKTLLDRYVGKTIKIVDYNRHHDRKDVLEATLLSNREGLIFRIGEEIYLGHPGIMVLPEVPENLTTEPTITWLFDNPRSGDHDITAVYLTGGIRWRSDYTFNIDADTNRGDLSSWVTIDNRSGTAWSNARVSLVAGEVRLVDDSDVQGFGEKALMARSAAVPDQFEEAPLFEYYRYDLQRTTSIENNQAVQVGFIDIGDVPFEREYRVSSPRLFPRSSPPGITERQSVEVYLTLLNDETSNLGIPLPAGVVRLYQTDGQGGTWFIGEDRIHHTPKDAEIRLRAGKTFDVTAERKQLEFRQVTSRVVESRQELSVTNRKDEAITVASVETLAGDWDILDSSHPFTVIDAFRVRFDLPVAPGETAILRYTVRTGT